MLQAHDVNITPEVLSTQVYIPERKGSLQVEMAVAARRNEMLPYPLQPRMLDLFLEVAAGNPVLVLQNPGFDWYLKWHYAVIIGYDTGTGEVVLM